MDEFLVQIEPLQEVGVILEQITLIKGDTGSQGIQGEKGETGAQGIQGIKGDTGVQGIQGEKGDTGPQGIQGVAGNNGIDGINGSPDTPEQIKSKLEELTDDNRLNASAVKNIPVYNHPESHPASIITQDLNNRFVSDAEKSTWNGYGAQIGDIKTALTTILGV